MDITTGIQDVFRDGNIPKILELLAIGFNMSIHYIASETTYQVDPATRCYVETRYMGTRLTASVCNGRQTRVNLLLTAGTDVNFADSMSMTPLMHAVINNLYNIQYILVYNRADVNSIETALVKAVVAKQI